MCTPIESASRVLDQIADRFTQGHHAYRDKLIEAGRLCREYVSMRRKDGASRSVAVQAIGGRLAETAGIKVDVNRLIGVAAVVDLLAVAVDFSCLPHRTLREFIPLVKREAGAHEDWKIKPGLEDRARELFRRAVDKRLDAQAVQAAVRELLGRQPRTRIPQPGDGGFTLEDLINMPASSLGQLLGIIVDQHQDSIALITALARHVDWQPQMGTALARILAEDAPQTANAAALVLLSRERQMATAG